MKTVITSRASVISPRLLHPTTAYILLKTEQGGEQQSCEINSRSTRNKLQTKVKQSLHFPSPFPPTLLLLHVSNFPKLPALLAPPPTEKWVKLSIHHPTRLSQNLLLSLENCTPAPSQVNDLPSCSLWEKYFPVLWHSLWGVLSLENFLDTFVTLVFFFLWDASNSEPGQDPGTASDR